MNVRPYFPSPRFMTDEQLRKHFGLSDRALSRLRMNQGFPRRDDVTNKTDRKAVDLFFDLRAGIRSPKFAGEVAGRLDGEENFDEDY
jgi:hypothetical protein